MNTYVFLCFILRRRETMGQDIQASDAVPVSGVHMQGTDAEESDVNRLWNLVKGERLSPETLFRIANEFPSLTQEAAELLHPHTSIPS